MGGGKGGLDGGKGGGGDEGGGDGADDTLKKRNGMNGCSPGGDSDAYGSAPLPRKGKFLVTEPWPSASSVSIITATPTVVPENGHPSRGWTVT